MHTTSTKKMLPSHPCPLLSITFQGPHISKGAAYLAFPSNAVLPNIAKFLVGFLSLHSQWQCENFFGMPVYSFVYIDTSKPKMCLPQWFSTFLMQRHFLNLELTKLTCFSLGHPHATSLWVPRLQVATVCMWILCKF